MRSGSNYPHPQKTIGARLIEFAMVLLALSLAGCLLPADAARPPVGGQTRTIYVSVDTWHAVIGFPTDEISSLTPHALRLTATYEEWGYAERGWYMEGRQGLTGVIRALFWPSDGVVEIGRYQELWATRTPQPPADLFIFRVSPESLGRLRDHLESTLASHERITARDNSLFYPAVQSYHLFHHCHHYVARALREAGLPISSLLAFNRGSLVWQLKRAVRLVNDAHRAFQIEPVSTSKNH